MKVLFLCFFWSICCQAPFVNAFHHISRDILLNSEIIKPIRNYKFGLLLAKSVTLRPKPILMTTSNHFYQVYKHTNTAAKTFMFTKRVWPRQNDDVEDDFSNSSQVNEVGQLIRATLLIAGTTVGGGFLALPRSVVIPLGGTFLVPATSLCIVWLFLLLQSFLLSNSIIECYNETKQSKPGLVYTVQNAFNSPIITTICYILLLMLTEATLVSQISCAGSLFYSELASRNAQSMINPVSAMRSMISYRLGCIIAGCTGATVTFGLSKRRSTNMNSLLTFLFLISVGFLFQSGRHVAIWSRCWINSTWSIKAILDATPTMLQLLVYGEIVPTVCHMLKYDAKKIRTSILCGSIIPLALLVGWTAFGIALIPDIAATQDPVSMLLKQGGSFSQWLLILSTTAICTTIFGCNLALESTYDDVTNVCLKSSSSNIRTITAAIVNQPLIKRLMILIPPMIISAVSPKVFLEAINFAGSYPVLILFGIIPALMNLRKKRSFASLTLLILSLTIICFEIISDLLSFVLLIKSAMLMR